ncbi:MAG: YebC/PmpR family DNA-binding transcriptional regulator [Alicyclobacillaceae bacterium]|nr:YebC/PmpR family DNA-binding transcriptional regulator [Alicyclobacillaceae bacterium]
MAGHSKWHNIQRRKGKQDAIRGQLFTKLCRDIYQAAKEAGGNPDTNFRLKVAIERARSANVPVDTITRTIAKATGSVEGVQYEELTYEGYGPGGIAVMLDIVTDNRNRTAAEIRHIFSKRGGSLGEAGCVSWMFRRIGSLVVVKEGLAISGDDLMMLALEAGADDVREEADVYEIVTAPEAFTAVRDALEQAGVKLEDAELTYEPNATVQVAGEQADAILSLMEALEQHDDVQNVYTNFELADSAAG